VVEVVGNSGIDRVSRLVKKAEELANEITETEFYKAMRDPDGFVSVRLVEDHLRVTNNANQAERSVLCDRVEASRRLGVVAKPGTITERVSD
jgi:hypothetical protein